MARKRQRRNKAEVAVSKFAKQAGLIADLGRAFCLVDSATLIRGLRGDYPIDKVYTYLLLAYLLECKLIKFASGKGKKSSKSLTIGVDAAKMKTITSDGAEFDTAIRSVHRTIPFAGIKKFPELGNFFRRIRSFTQQGEGTPSMKMPAAPRTWGLEETGAKLEFKTRVIEAIYHLVKLLERLNAGDFGPSNVVEAIQNHLAKRKRLFPKHIAKFIKDLENLISKDQQIDMVLSKEAATTYEIPDINPNMLPHRYQWKGTNWILTGKRGVLAFDVGLGKTLIAVLTTYILIRQGKIGGAFIFTTKSTMPGFRRQIEMIWPDARVVTITGGIKDRMEALGEVPNADFVLTSYSPLSRQMPEMIKMYNDHKNYAVFLDEGGALRTTRTAMHQTAKKILEDREYAIILDATPTPNNVMIEAHNLVQLLFPNQLGTMRAWKANFSAKEKVETEGKEVSVIKDLDKMRERLSPFFFVKKYDSDDVNLDMPPGEQRVQEFFTLGPIQRKWYDKAAAWTLHTMIDFLNPNNKNYRNIRHILVALTRQRQCAVDPWLIDESYNGDTARLDVMVDKVEKWFDSDSKQGILIGSDYTKMFPRWKAAIVKRFADRPGKNKITEDQIAIFDGKVNKIEDRSAIEQGFNAGKIKVILAAYRAAGRGINLQDNCSRVILVHKPYNPDIVHQFEGRVNRQGQKNRVLIFELLADGTIDERIEEILFRKEEENRRMYSADTMRLKQNQYSLADMATMAGVSIDRVLKKADLIGLNTGDIDVNEARYGIG